jgi:hypothetical protein
MEVEVVKFCRTHVAGEKCVLITKPEVILCERPGHEGMD